MTRKVCILALFAVTWAFYSWTARSNGKPFVFENSSEDNYNLLVDGFLQGHLYLPIAPNPKLLQTADPLNPEQNAPYRLHDISLYRGKFYFYFGAAPAVTLMLPFRLLTHTHMPENLAVAVFLFGGLVGLFRKLRSTSLSLQSSCLVFAISLRTYSEGPPFTNWPLPAATFTSSQRPGCY
jgi:hypothetical protein